MPIWPGHLVQRITGRLGDYIYTTRPDGSVIARRARSGPGPGGQHPTWKYCTECVKLLDIAQRKFTFEQNSEWLVCSPIIHGHRLSHLGHYYRVNLPRMLFGFPGIISPPNAFKSRKVYWPHGGIDDPHGTRKIGVWVEGESKDGQVFDRGGPYHEEDYKDPLPIPVPPDPPWTPPPPPPPPEDTACPTTQFCIDACRPRYILRMGAFWCYRRWEESSSAIDRMWNCFWLGDEDEFTATLSCIYALVPAGTMEYIWELVVLDNANMWYNMGYYKLAYALREPLGRYDYYWHQGCREFPPFIHIV